MSSVFVKPLGYYHNYFAVCIVRTSIPFYALNDALIAAIDHQAGNDEKGEKVISLRVLGSTNGAHQAERLWYDIKEGDRILEEMKVKAPTAPAQCLHCRVYKELLEVTD